MSSNYFWSVGNTFQLLLESVVNNFLLFLECVKSNFLLLLESVRNNFLLFLESVGNNFLLLFIWSVGNISVLLRKAWNNLLCPPECVEKFPMYSCSAPNNSRSLLNNIPRTPGVCGTIFSRTPGVRGTISLVLQECMEQFSSFSRNAQNNFPCTPGVHKTISIALMECMK